VERRKVEEREAQSGRGFNKRIDEEPRGGAVGRSWLEKKGMGDRHRRWTHAIREEGLQGKVPGKRRAAEEYLQLVGVAAAGSFFGSLGKVDD